MRSWARSVGAAVLLLTASAMAACGATAPGWGPLAAVAAPQDLAVGGATIGILVITADCVFLEHPVPFAERRHLLLPADRTAWAPGSRSILFRKLDGEMVTLASGDHLEVSLPLEEVPDLRWVARPALACDTPGSYLVLDVHPR